MRKLLIRQFGSEARHPSPAIEHYLYEGLRIAHYERTVGKLWIKARNSLPLGLMACPAVACEEIRTVFLPVLRQLNCVNRFCRIDLRAYVGNRFLLNRFSLIPPRGTDVRENGGQLFVGQNPTEGGHSGTTVEHELYQWLLGP